MTKKIYVETLKSVLGRSISHYWKALFIVVPIGVVFFTFLLLCDVLLYQIQNRILEMCLV